MSQFLRVRANALAKRWRYFLVLFRRSLRGGQMDFTRGPMSRAVFLLAIPMVLEMVMESVFALTDIFFVARLGAAAVAVVGLTEAAITLLYAVAVGLSMGTTAMVARRIGEKNDDAAAVVAVQSLWLGLAVSVLVAVAGLIYADDILRLLGAEPEVIASGSSYTRILLGGSITVMYLFLINAVFRGAGDAGIAMRALWLANGINIVLDPLLIFGIGPFPEMGVAGAATATTIGRGVGVIYQLYRLTMADGRVHVLTRHVRITTQVLKRLVHVSLGGVGQFIIATSSWIVLMKIVSIYGREAIAGYTIAIRVIMFTILPAWGMSNAAATLVGQNLGAGKAERAERSVWQVARYNVIFLLIIALGFIIFANPIISIFSSDPQVIAYGADCLRFVAYGYGFFAVGMVMVQALNGAGDTRTPTVVNFFCYWMIQLPLAWLLATQLSLGPQGVFLSITIAESLLAAVGVWVFRRGAWKRKEV